MTDGIEMHNNASDGLSPDHMILARSKMWTPELDKLLRRWKKQLGKREKGHLDLARKYSRRHYFFGVPATVLSALIATGILSTFRNCDDTDDLTSSKCSTDQWIRFVIGIVGLIGAGLSAFQTFMNYQGESENHKSAADEYGSMYRILDTMLLVPGPVRGDPISTLQNLRSQYDDLVRRSPTLPKKYDVELTYEVIQPKKIRAPPPEQIQISSPAEGDGGMDDLKKMMGDISTETETAKPLKPKNVGFNSGAAFDSLNKIFEDENDHDTSDDEYEVCIGFDLDAAGCYNTTAVALAAAQLATKRDIQIQSSLRHALDFELQRLEGHSRVTPRENRRKRKKEIPPSPPSPEKPTSAEVVIDMDDPHDS